MTWSARVGRGVAPRDGDRRERRGLKPRCWSGSRAPTTSAPGA